MADSTDPREQLRQQIKEKAVVVFPNLTKQYAPAGPNDENPSRAFHITTCYFPPAHTTATTTTGETSSTSSDNVGKFQSFLTYDADLDRVDNNKVLAQGMRGDLEDSVQNLLDLMERARQQVEGLSVKIELQGRSVREIRGMGDEGEWIGRDSD